MTRGTENGVRSGRKTAWSVVVVYEDPAARERAVAFCDQLVGRFWERFEFEVSWWPFALLGEAGSGREAAQRAAQADLLVFSAKPEEEFPLVVKRWNETWLSQRGSREGLLACVTQPAAAPGGHEGPRQHYLRLLAHRAAMDYLTQVPPDISRTIPDSIEWYSRRADEVSGVLDDILHRQPPPPSLPA